MKANQKGFSVVEILIVIVTVGLLVAVGWVAYDRQKSKTDDSQTNTQTTEQSQETPREQKSTTNNDAQKYMTIKEWGVKLPVDSSVGGLSYTITGKYASIRSDELDKLSGSCESNSVNVARGMANEVVPNETGNDEGATFLETYNSITVDNNNLTARDIKAKSGNYYFVVPGFAGASCVGVTYDEPAGRVGQEAETIASLNIVKAINKLVQQ